MKWQKKWPRKDQSEILSALMFKSQNSNVWTVEQAATKKDEEVECKIKNNNHIERLNNYSVAAHIDIPTKYRISQSSSQSVNCWDGRKFD